MNNKKAKKLRREAEVKTVGMHPAITKKVYKGLKADYKRKPAQQPKFRTSKRATRLSSL